MIIVILILAGLLILFILWKMIKPYFLKYDKDLMIVGAPGSGKTCTGVKEAIKIIRRERFWYWIEYKFKLKIRNHFIRKHNKREEKRFIKRKNYVTHLKEELQPIPKPQIYSFIPIHFKPHWWSSKSKREWCCKLKISHLLLLEEIAQNSVCLLDDLPQAVNQFNWDIELLKINFNEYAGEHRHYYNNYNIITSQAVAEIVVQLRRKMNKATLMMYFHKVPFLPIYKAQACDIITNELVSTMASTLFDENTRTYWGLLPAKHTYDSRCYSERIKNIMIPLQRGKAQERFSNLKTNELVEFDPKKISPLNDWTTEKQKQAMYNQYIKQLGTHKPKGTQQDLDKIVKEETNEFTQEEKEGVLKNENN